ncbi:hypothetical protein [Pelagicoccus sp. SDUM812002]|uniref:hypothetical protein n=1 Tax=Pelagicoccus sp. SDUM812002 TaxID=3041266 RepID=UPI00281241BD|nr:hypothetical protein [Pelagicoccus sp. SDUM812002]
MKSQKPDHPLDKSRLLEQKKKGNKEGHDHYHIPFTYRHKQAGLYFSTLVWIGYLQR